MRAAAIARKSDPMFEARAESLTKANPLSLVPKRLADPERSIPTHLTARQLEVLALLCEGLPNKLICRRLDIAAGTVKAHISSILRELGVGSRLQAVVWARRRGLLSDSGDPAQREDAQGEVDAGNETAMTILRRRALN